MAWRIKNHLRRCVNIPRTGFVLSNTITAANYDGNDSTETAYPVPFEYRDADHVFVDVAAKGSGTVTIDEDGGAVFSQAQDEMQAGHKLWIYGDLLTVVSRTDSTHFVVTAGFPGSSVPFVNVSLPETLQANEFTLSADGVRTTVAVPSTSRVSIYRRTPSVMETAIPETGKFPAAAVESALDFLTLRVQELQSQVDGTGVSIPAGYAGNVLQDSAVFSDAADRSLRVPKRTGQLGVQLDNGMLYRATSTSAGAWSPPIVTVDGTSKVFYPTAFTGAAIQTALDAAESAGGGIVQLGYGDYDIQVVNSPASGDKSAGAYGLEIPSGVTLQGMGDSTVLRIIADGDYGVGCGISPKGMRTATAGADGFGNAATDFTLRRFKILAPVAANSAGNLLALVHADRVLVEDVHMAGSMHHGLEIDQSRNLTFRRCRWSGSYTGVSGCPIQFDYGAAGPVNRPVGITFRAIEDVLFDQCTVDGDAASARKVEFTHNGTELQLRRVTFKECTLIGANTEFTSIADIAGANTGGSVEELLFDRCKFVTVHPKAYAFSMLQASGMTFRGIRFRGCEFRGPSGTFIVMGGSTSATYNATHSLRWEGEISNCRFLFDKSQMPVSLDVNLVIANAWSSFTFADNYIEATGDFPVSVGMNYSRLLLCNNNLLTRVMRNSANWAGTGSFGVGAAGFIVDIALADVAGTTRGLYVQDNVLYSTAGTGWSYGIAVTTGATFPANRAFSYNGNFANFANTATNNIVAAGGTVGFSTTSGGVGSALRNTTASTTLNAADFILNCNTASGSITVTAAPVLGRRCYILIKTNASNSLICGSTTVTALGAGILVYTDGTSTFTKAF